MNRSIGDEERLLRRPVHCDLTGTVTRDVQRNQATGEWDERAIGDVRINLHWGDRFRDDHCRQSGGQPVEPPRSVVDGWP